MCAHAEAEAIQATAEGEDRILTEDEQSQFDAKLADQKALLNRADLSDKVAAGAATLKESQGRRVPAGADLHIDASGLDDLKAGDITGVRERLADDPKLGFVGLGDFATAVKSAYSPNAGQDMDHRLQIGAAVSGLSQGTGSDGGFLLPPEFSTTIWDGMNREPDNMLARTDQFTVTGESLTFPANAETSRATGSRWGGIQGYWIAEAAQVTKSKPKLRQVKIEPQQLAVLVYATDKLLNASGPALTQWLTRAATTEINFLVGNSILAGDGVGKPVGIIGHASTVSVAKETAGGAQGTATIVKENIDKMWSRCHANARGNAVWFINQDCEPQLEQLAADVGTGGVPVYLPAGGITDTPNARLKGRPVVVSEFCKTVGTVGDIILADLQAYLTGVRGGIDTAMSMHLRFDYLESVFRFVFAVDGQPWLASKITPFNGGSTKTLSPFVTLATRA
ncbi:hypothetical protein LCGC14_0714550 [marine sediment metagenome]|uniref:Phage capsid-like C-terminal domain-containing protein n=1 Tax=marine sediment metagenome TaxID=412755 RepID=A0A0F9SZP1_9ZZZZ